MQPGSPSQGGQRGVGVQSSLRKGQEKDVELLIAQTTIGSRVEDWRVIQPGERKRLIGQTDKRAPATHNDRASSITRWS